MSRCAYSAHRAAGLSGARVDVRRRPRARDHCGQVSRGLFTDATLASFEGKPITDGHRPRTWGRKTMRHTRKGMFKTSGERMIISWPICT